jgi:hypothetical protein
MVEQTINIFRLIEFISVILTIIISAMVIGRGIKKGYKTYIDTKIDIMDLRTTGIEKEISELKRDNQREHDMIKRDFVERVDMIFNWIKKNSA